MANHTENPITRRLEQMARQWLEFEELPSARVGRWVIQENEVRMMEAFIASEETEEGKLPSVFFYTPVPFIDKSTYPKELIRYFVESCSAEQNLEDLKEAGLTEAFIRSYEGRTDERAWIEFLAAFAEKIQRPISSLVACLLPERVENHDQFLDWLLELLQGSWPEKLRIMLVDLESQGVYAELESRYPDRVKSLYPNLDMQGAFEELAATPGANDPNDPGILFRVALVRLMNHSRPGMLEEAKRDFEEALRIASGQSWHHLEVAAHLALATAMLNNQSFTEIYRVYEQARAAAKKIEPEDITLSHRLTVQAWMGEGAAYLTEQRYEEATQAYISAAPLAEGIDDHILCLESWRMAGFCSENIGEVHDAWDYNWKAVNAAQKLPDDQRGNTTLSFVGQSLLNLIDDTGRGSNDRIELLETFDTLLGPDWQEKPLTPQAT